MFRLFNKAKSIIPLFCNSVLYFHFTLYMIYLPISIDFNVNIMTLDDLSPVCIDTAAVTIEQVNSTI